MSPIKVMGFAALLALTNNTFASNEVNTESLSYDALLSSYQYDFEVNYFNIESQKQSLKMAYIYLKPAKENMPIVTLMHGKNFNADYWTTTAQYLQSLGFGVLIPDQIGFGKSSKPTDYQYSFAALAHHTQALMSSLNIQSSIVLGHSMGGMLASRFALMYPNTTTKLILLNPIGLENYLHYVEYKDTNFFYKNELNKTPEGVKKYQQKNYYNGKWNATYSALTHFITGQIQGPDKEQIAWVNAKTYDMIFTQPVITEFKDLTMPVKLIIGTRDRTGPGRNWKKDGVTYELGRYDELGKNAASLIPNAKLYELDNLGHLPQIEDFERFKTVFKEALAAE
ncbi:MULTISPECIES: alpha/beta hydrolase [unclassified Pseudoalteromonas]|uniref:alpha/beta fold hydrolase n=1 Tax=unclassified Pseudoalteromonas TaxID=194690 RepID=UPI001109B52E|nr:MULTISPECIES: alpha/beta hydrolase [unclassified Pseudoalteromonas]MBW4965477.1 alpha/beta hydrolase [Pseudoalteromonas sp. CR1]TMN76769.1 alpha/beta hydrolase [Pseudoalteromonas sp. S410]TMN87535.1 alpha/beta hydrolase [Pseudoalteromonas sp. S408]TMN94462.1 alpha/beta hydrolase [Pseudoalteromonas sp. S407]TMO01693.1 alpha/beta hydrolase [Pseudoalteromonas sp. S409]|tara:strand:- start:1100 stop:2116 length:1017 start_codon:yes stop_codon:yes gene_type:complete